MQELRQQIRQIAQTDATVLIEGESGTGKELVARAIHYESKRKDNSLVIVDCAAIPSALIESEFFGHEKGAFTGAQEQRVGRFEEANTGTIFLDEIGELPLEAQTKLLRVLQEREFMRVGSNVPIKVDVRVACATNKNLESQVKAGEFREDLYYRLNVCRLLVPSLREHTEDIPRYVDHFIAKHREAFGTSNSGVSDEALSFLKAAEWRGNIRELENAVQRALVNARGRRIEIPDVVFLRHKDIHASSQYQPGRSLEEYVTSLVAQTERNIIIETLKQTHWNRTEAAERLKISRKTLFNKMQQYGIDSERPE
jgi:DNA-binding NtrC family response regulator